MLCYNKGSQQVTAQITLCVSNFAFQSLSRSHLELQNVLKAITIS